MADDDIDIDWLDAAAVVLFVLIAAMTVLNLLAMFGSAP